MPRRPYKKRIILPDPLYNSLLVSKLINYVMVDGKKSVAKKIVYSVMEEIKKKGLDPLATLEEAVKNTGPLYEVRPRRLGGASYMVPFEVRKERRLFLALNWIIQAAKARSNKQYRTFADKLLAEILDASSNIGQAVIKKQQAEKLADSNKAFAHLRW